MRDPERFVAGEAHSCDGIEFRIQEGTKDTLDLVLQWLTPTGWRTITCEPWFLFIDFVAWNEDLLHPYPRKGGQKLLDEMRRARIQGWRAAVVRLQEERARSAERAELHEGSPMVT